MKFYEQCTANRSGAIHIESASKVLGAAAAPPCAYRRSRTYSPHLSSKQGAFAALTQKIREFFLCHALPISGVRITAPIVLAQHKGHKRINEVQKAIQHALPIFFEIASSFSCTDQKRKYVQYMAQTYYRKKTCPVPQSQANTKRLAYF